MSCVIASSMDNFKECTIPPSFIGSADTTPYFVYFTLNSVRLAKNEWSNTTLATMTILPEEESTKPRQY